MGGLIHKYFSVSRRIISFLMAVLLIIPMAQLHAANQYKKASKIKVETIKGEKFEGRLLAVPDETLVVWMGDENYTGFPVSFVKTARVKKGKVMFGMSMGGIAGLFLGIILVSVVVGIIAGTSVSSLADLFALLIIGSVVILGALIIGAILLTIGIIGGGLLGFLFAWKKFNFYKMNDVQKRNAILKLKKYSFYGSVLPEKIKEKLKVYGEEKQNMEVAFIPVQLPDFPRVW